MDLILLISFLSWLTRLIVANDNVKVFRWIVRLLVSLALGVLVFETLGVDHEYLYFYVALSALWGEDLVLIAVRLGVVLKQNPLAIIEAVKKIIQKHL